MVKAIKQTVMIQSGGKIEVTSDQLPEGQQAEVIILLNQKPPAKSYQALFGCGKGGFESPEAADKFLRGERDAWDH